MPSDDEYDHDNGGQRNGHGGGGAENSSIGAPTPRRDGSPFSAQGEGDYDAAGNAQDYADDQEEAGGADGGDGSGYDSDLANEINKGMAALDDSASEDEDDSASDAGGLFGGSSDDDEEEEEQQVDPETAEMKKKVKLLLEETGDLERAIQVSGPFYCRCSSRLTLIACRRPKRQKLCVQLTRFSKSDSRK